MNNPDSAAGAQLANHMIYVSDEGIDFDLFVAQGGWLVRRANSTELASGLPAVHSKIVALRETHPRLARQLDFLVRFLDSGSAHLPEPARNEGAFALIYAAKETDLIPDEMPGVGYLDDVAVTETVLSRHSELFADHCAASGLEWADVRPEGAASK